MLGQIVIPLCMANYDTSVHNQFIKAEFFEFFGFYDVPSQHCTADTLFSPICYLTWTLTFSNIAGSPRPPFDDLIQKLVHLCSYDQNRQKPPVIVSVDIPSGWHVEEGHVGGEGIKPDMLVCF